MPKYSKYNIDFLLLLLRKLGFNDENRRNEYLTHLLNTNVIERKARSINFGEDINQYNYGNSVLELIDEIFIRKNPQDILQKEKASNFYVNATDIANFSFCPAYFAINRTFETPRLLNNLLIVNGTKLHEKGLLNFSKDHTLFNKDRENRAYSLPDEHINKILKIKSCRNLFIGHKAESKVFSNKEFKFYGQPDYIFESPMKEKFVVEEKFSIKNMVAFENQKLQLAAYIRFIKDFDIKFGLLINWLYDTDYEGKQYIKNVTVTTVYLNALAEKLDAIYTSIEEFYHKGSVEFNVQKINPKKCSNCSLRTYCGHKTGEFNMLKYPYANEYLSLSKLVNFDELQNTIPLGEMKELFNWTDGLN